MGKTVEKTRKKSFGRDTSKFFKGLGQRMRRFFIQSQRTWQLYVFFLLPLIYLLIFKYYPMFGAQIAFKNYSPSAGIWGSEWVGFKHFETFFKSYQFKRVITNTLRISLYSLVVTFPLPIIFALMLNTLRNDRLKKSIQTITYMPHFISIVVLIGILQQIFNPVSGVYGTFYKLFGGSGYPKDPLGKPNAFLHIHVWSTVWQHLGYSSIIYIAALSGVDMELHEAAKLDGATRFQRVLYVDLPAILPTVAIMLILRFGGIMNVGFEKIFLLQKDLNLVRSEVISTYVYKVGLRSPDAYSYGTAIGLFNSVINAALLVIMNAVSRKLSDREVSLW